MLSFLELLEEANRQVNLTRILGDDMVEFHLLDALTLFPLVQEIGASRIVDVGSGAGVPGVVLATALPNLSFTLIDSVRKKLAFIERACAHLGLSNVNVVHGRAEDLGHDGRFRERFDLAVARAVADTRLLSELLLPLVKVGGRMIAMKGPDVGDEIARAEDLLLRCGGRVAEVFPVELPFSRQRRSLVVLDKCRPTPSSFPRNPSNAGT